MGDIAAGGSKLRKTDNTKSKEETLVKRQDFVSELTNIGLITLIKNIKTNIKRIDNILKNDKCLQKAAEDELQRSHKNVNDKDYNELLSAKIEEYKASLAEKKQWLGNQLKAGARNIDKDKLADIGVYIGSFTKHMDEKEVVSDKFNDRDRLGTPERKKAITSAASSRKILGKENEQKKEEINKIKMLLSNYQVIKDQADILANAIKNLEEQSIKQIKIAGKHIESFISGAEEISDYKNKNIYAESPYAYILAPKVYYGIADFATKEINAKTIKAFKGHEHFSNLHPYLQALIMKPEEELLRINDNVLEQIVKEIQKQLTKSSKSSQSMSDTNKSNKTKVNVLDIVKQVWYGSEVQKIKNAVKVIKSDFEKYGTMLKSDDNDLHHLNLLIDYAKNINEQSNEIDELIPGFNLQMVKVIMSAANVLKSKLSELSTPSAAAMVKKIDYITEGLEDKKIWNFEKLSDVWGALRDLFRGIQGLLNYDDAKEVKNTKPEEQSSKSSKGVNSSKVQEIKDAVEVIRKDFEQYGTMLKSDNNDLHHLGILINRAKSINEQSNEIIDGATSDFVVQMVEVVMPAADALKSKLSELSTPSADAMVKKIDDITKCLEDKKNWKFEELSKAWNNLRGLFEGIQGLLNYDAWINEQTAKLAKILAKIMENGLDEMVKVVADDLKLTDKQTAKLDKIVKDNSDKIVDAIIKDVKDKIIKDAKKLEETDDASEQESNEKLAEKIIDEINKILSAHESEILGTEEEEEVENPEVDKEETSIPKPPPLPTSPEGIAMIEKAKAEAERKSKIVSIEENLKKLESERPHLADAISKIRKEIAKPTITLDELHNALMNIIRVYSGKLNETVLDICNIFENQYKDAAISDKKDNDLKAQLKNSTAFETAMKLKEINSSKGNNQQQEVGDDVVGDDEWGDDDEQPEVAQKPVEQPEVAKQPVKQPEVAKKPVKAFKGLNTISDWVERKAALEVDSTSEPAASSNPATKSAPEVNPTPEPAAPSNPATESAPAANPIPEPPPLPNSPEAKKAEEAKNAEEAKKAEAEAKAKEKAKKAEAEEARRKAEEADKEAKEKIRALRGRFADDDDDDDDDSEEFRSYDPF